MTKGDGSDSAKSISDLSMLDDLIQEYYDKILANKEKEVKLGDLLKMIELRRKLVPADDNQKEFWKMLDQIRRENLNSAKTKTNKSRVTKKKSTRAGKASRGEDK